MTLLIAGHLINADDDGFELPPQLWLKVVEIAVRTGRTEEDVVVDLVKSVLEMAESSGQAELKGFAKEAIETMRQDPQA